MQIIVNSRKQIHKPNDICAVGNSTINICTTEKISYGPKKTKHSQKISLVDLVHGVGLGFTVKAESKLTKVNLVNNFELSP